MVTADGDVPNTVVCEDCGRAVNAQAVWWASYTETPDGWYVPDIEKGPAPALLASPSAPSASATPLPPTPSV